ncbi:ATP-binding cassette domain-containing protein [Planomonospora algeriensis]
MSTSVSTDEDFPPGGPSALPALPTEEGPPAGGPAAAGGNRLRVEELTVSFRLPGATVRAVTGASFEVRPGRCLALVGESGCGKSVLAHALLGLLPGNAEVAGTARLEHAGGSLELLGAPEAVLARRVRGRAVGLIPQSPATHLTPVRTARAQLEEALRELGHRGRGNAPTSSRCGRACTPPTSTAIRTSCPAAWPSGWPTRWRWPGTRG